MGMDYIYLKYSADLERTDRGGGNGGNQVANSISKSELEGG